MDSLQQSIFQNFSKNTQYKSSSRKITQRHQIFPKYRRQQIQNQFQLVDLHNEGKLSQRDIITYLSDKYQWINTDILRSLFNDMNWDQSNFVTKQQFITKYLTRQRKLYHQINGLKYYQNWVQTLQQIYLNQTLSHIDKPRVYFYTQIRSIQLYHQQQQIQWLDLKAIYQNHENKKYYQIQQIMHQCSYPSFQIWLPAKTDPFFLKFQFYDPHHPSTMYGQTYLQIPLNNKVNKINTQTLQITKNGQKVGHCLVYVYAQGSMQKVGEQLNQLKSKQRIYSDAINDKIKQYQYLQFLWGTRQKSPNKILSIQVSSILWIRMILIIILGLLGIGIHVLGRYQPLSLIIVFIMLKTWQFVLLRYQKFMLAWLTISSMVLDIIWIILSSSDLNQINFLSQQSNIFITYIFFGTKTVLLTYLLIAEKSMSGQ